VFHHRSEALIATIYRVWHTKEHNPLLDVEFSYY